MSSVRPGGFSFDVRYVTNRPRVQRFLETEGLGWLRHDKLKRLLQKSSLRRSAMFIEPGVEIVALRQETSMLNVRVEKLE